MPWPIARSVSWNPLRVTCFETSRAGIRTNSGTLGPGLWSQDFSRRGAGLRSKRRKAWRNRDLCVAVDQAAEGVGSTACRVGSQIHCSVMGFNVRALALARASLSGGALSHVSRAV
jgi:hypothetical protein